MEAFKEERTVLEKMKPEANSEFENQLGKVRTAAEVLDERLLDDLALRLETDPRIRQEMANRGLKFWRDIRHEPDAKIEQQTTA
jgi:isopenicillin N synthase-like dioxygenase